MAIVQWEMLHKGMTLEHLGLLVDWLDDEDPRKAAEQMDSRYQFGGFSRHPITGFRAEREKCLKYPGDPLLRPLAKAQLRDEVVMFYDCAVVAVWQPDGTFVAARFD
jgi:hypothetical protein